MDKKYQIFISSTYVDLIPERNIVRDVILKMYQFPIGMEMFSAADEDQWEIIQETIDSSDYYVLILGKRYGSIIPEGKPNAGMSYTEKEYRYANSHGIPVLTFIKNDSAVTADKMDTDPDSISKLKALIDEITKNREVDMFNTVEELGTKVTLALHKQIDRKKRPGWVRGDRFDVDASLNEIVELSKRVRELEDENKHLKNSITIRKPSLIVGMQLMGTISNPSRRDSTIANQLDHIGQNFLTSEELNISRIPEYDIVYPKSPLDSKEIPDDVKDFVTQDMINEYNSKLPSKEAVENYNKDLNDYNSLQINGHLLDFVVLNKGTAKATNVFISLTFPYSFTLVDRSVAKRQQKPQKPSLPDNPIEKAYERKNATGIDTVFRVIQNAMKSDLVHFPLPSMIDVEPLSLSKQLADYKVNIDNDGKTVKIWIRDLLHSLTRTADSLCIIPLDKGTFKIKVSIMCEEYLEPDESELEIAVR